MQERPKRRIVDQAYARCFDFNVVQVTFSEKTGEQEGGVERVNLGTNK